MGPLIVLVLFTTLVNVQTYELTNLEKYIAIDDGFFNYTLVDTYDQYENFTLYLLNVTSQKWLDETLVDKYIWWHYVGVAVPRTLTIFDQATLIYIGGSSNNNEPPPATDELFLITGELAHFSGQITICINQIPNAPIHYTRDPSGNGLGSDSSISWSWKQWTIVDNMTSPVELLLYFPMVKGGVRAIDATVDFIGGMFGLSLDKWIVGGPSKWGWCTWLHGAVDDRVVGIIPIVMNLLNNRWCMASMYSQLGGWSFAMEPYWRNDITTLWGHQLDELNKNQDPYEFRHLMNIPKLIIQGTDDEYFLPDNHWFWLHNMPGHNMVWMLENTDHVIIGHWARTLTNIVAFIRGIHQGFQFPHPTWEGGHHADIGWIELESPTEPLEVVGWRANITDYELDGNGKMMRDFRMFRAPYDWEAFPESVRYTGIRWYPKAVDRLPGTNIWRLEVNTPAEGWEGLFIAMTYKGPEDRDFYLSTEVYIFPKIYPYENCDPGAACKGKLV